MNTVAVHHTVAKMATWRNFASWAVNNLNSSQPQLIQVSSLLGESAVTVVTFSREFHPASESMETV